MNNKRALYQADRYTQRSIRSLQHNQQQRTHWNWREQSACSWISKKAHDSLSRGFLSAVLTRRGFLTRFVDMVTAVHAGTYGRFLVNGYLSRPTRITSGIRQGVRCHLCYFVVVLDVLY